MKKKWKDNYHIEKNKNKNKKCIRFSISQHLWTKTNFNFFWKNKYYLYNKKNIVFPIPPN